MKRLSDLKGLERNPRKISKQQLDALKKSLATLGDLSGIVFNRRNGRLAGAHQRLKVLPPEAEITITESFDTPNRCGTVAVGYVLIDGEQFSYREVDWDDITHLTATAAANKHGGEWDFVLLPEILLELDAQNIDMELTGFSAEEQQKILAPLDFSPGSEEDQGKLDQKKLVFMECPHCGKQFEQGQARKIED